MNQKGQEPRARTKKSMNQKEHEQKRARTKKSKNKKEQEPKTAQTKNGTNQKGQEPKRGTNQKVVTCGKLHYFNQNTICLFLGIETQQI